MKQLDQTEEFCEVKMGKTSNRPSVINMDLNFARLIIRSYDENNETYLRNLVRKHVPNAERVLSCADRSNLLYHTRTIRGVARKINRHDLQISEQNQDILDNFDNQLDHPIYEFQNLF